jgi:transcriptional regulator with XRE-family HTH domain
MTGGQANRVKALRSSVGLTQEELARLLGVSLRTLSRWEKGETTPTLRNARRLARRLRVAVEELGLPKGR